MRVRAVQHTQRMSQRRLRRMSVLLKAQQRWMQTEIPLQKVALLLLLRAASSSSK